MITPCKYEQTSRNQIAIRRKGKLNLHVAHTEGIWILDNNIVHVDGTEFGETYWQGNEVDGRRFVELKEAWITTIISYPTQISQDSFKRCI